MAVLSRAEFLVALADLNAEYTSKIANNVTGDISPADIRDILDSQNSIFNDLVFSYLNTSSADLGSLSGSSGLPLVVNVAQNGFEIGIHRAWAFQNGNTDTTTVSAAGGDWSPLNVTLGALVGASFAVDSGNGLKYLGLDTFTFKVTLRLSGMKTSAAGGDNYKFGLSKDGGTTILGGFMSKSLDNTSDESCSIDTTVDLSTNDILIAYTEPKTGSTNIDVENISMRISLF